MRGKTQVEAFSAAMLATLNEPRNAAKGDWRAVGLSALVEKLREERTEVDIEIVSFWSIDRYYKCDGEIDCECFNCVRDRLMAECVDEANVLMMIWDIARGNQNESI